MISGLADEQLPSSNLDEIWKLVHSNENNLLGDIKFSDLLIDGIQINGSSWAHLNFAEKSALHFTPLGVSSDD